MITATIVLKLVMLSILADGSAVAHPTTLGECKKAAQRLMLGLTPSFVPAGGGEAVEVTMIMCLPEDAFPPPELKPSVMD